MRCRWEEDLGVAILGQEAVGVEAQVRSLKNLPFVFQCMRFALEELAEQRVRRKDDATRLNQDAECATGFRERRFQLIRGRRMHHEAGESVELLQTTCY